MKHNSPFFYLPGGTAHCHIFPAWYPYVRTDVTGHINMNDFRDTMEKTIKEIMRERLLLIQEETHFNNQQMARALIMDPRSFFDLRNGENECGLTTSMMIIIYTSDRNALLNEMDIRLRNCMDKSEEKETLPV